MGTAILAADLLLQMQRMIQPSTPDSNLDVEGGENDFPGYFNEAMNREIADKPGASLNNNLTGEVCSVKDYSKNASSEGLGIQLETIVDESNIMKLDDTVIAEMNASLFLSLLGFSNEDIKTALHSMGEADSPSDIKTVDFLKNLGFGEETAKEIVAQVIAQVNSAINSGQTEKINSENSITQVLAPLQNYNDLISNIKQIIFNGLQEKTLSSSEKAFLKPAFEPLKKADAINSLLAQQIDSPSPYVEGKEQNVDSDISGGDNFSLNAKEYVALKQGDSVSKAGVENISQLPKTVVDRAVINQIVEKASIFIRRERNEIKIHLDPPSLGSVHIKVSMESHNMKATMVTDTPYVKEVIESNLGELKRSLSELGIKVDQFSVLVGNGYDYKNGRHDLISQIEQTDEVRHEVVNLSDSKIEAGGNIDSRNIINIFI